MNYNWLTVSLAFLLEIYQVDNVSAATFSTVAATRVASPGAFGGSPEASAAVTDSFTASSAEDNAVLRPEQAVTGGIQCSSLPTTGALVQSGLPKVATSTSNGAAQDSASVASTYPKAAESGSEEEMMVCGECGFDPQALQHIDVGHIIDVAKGSSTGIDKTVDLLCAVAEELGFNASLGVVGGTIGYGIAGAGSAVIGTSKIVKGVKQGKADQVIDGVGDVTGGLSNGMASVAVATSAATGALNVVGGVARILMTPLGVASGAIEAGLGVKDIVQGVKTGAKHKIASGALAAGYGLATVAACVGGGLPAIIISGITWAARMGVALHERKHPDQQPVALTDSQTSTPSCQPGEAARANEVSAE